MLCLGVANVKDTQISTTMTASTSYSGHDAPSHGIIAASRSTSWRPVTNAGTQYLQAQLGDRYYVTSVQVKGGSNNYVKSFHVKYLSKSGSWVITA